MLEVQQIAFQSFLALHRVPPASFVSQGLRDLYPTRFKLWYTLDCSPEGWMYSTGFIDEAMIKEHMPPPSPDTLVLMCAPARKTCTLYLFFLRFLTHNCMMSPTRCGPPPMVKFACMANLEKLGYDKKSQVAF